MWHPAAQNVAAHFIGHFQRDGQQMKCLLQSLKGHDKKACLLIANSDTDRCTALQQTKNEVLNKTSETFFLLDRTLALMTRDNVDGSWPPFFDESL